MRILFTAVLLIACLLGFLALVGGGSLAIWSGLTSGDYKTALGGLAVIYFLIVSE